MAEENELDPLTSLPKDEGKKAPTAWELRGLSKEDYYKNITQGSEAIMSKIGSQQPSSTRFTSPMIAPSTKPLFQEFDIKEGARKAFGGEGYEYEAGRKRQMFTPGKGYSAEDFDHYAKMVELKYIDHVKKYQDDLAKNQSNWDKLGNVFSNLIGKTLVNAGGGLIGTLYGAGKALLTWDQEPLRRNAVFTAAEDATQWIDNRFVVHGDSGYDPHSGIGTRFTDNPWKVINDDVADGLAFVGGIVVTELLAKRLGVKTGATQTFIKTPARNLALFGDKVKLLRGIKVPPGLQQQRAILNSSKKYEKLLGTTRATLMGAGYESALMARETEDRTLEMMIKRYKATHNGMEPTGQVLNQMKEEAAGAAQTSYWLNMGLVGGSNFIQFGNLFNRFKGNQSVYKALKKDIGDTFRVTGKGRDKFWIERLTNRDLHWSLAVPYQVLRKPVTEAFEEYAQGVIDWGTSDWYSSKYSDNAAQGVSDMISTYSDNAYEYFKSTEGKDSMIMGFLLGLTGFPVPSLAKNKKTGKRKILTAYGGIADEIRGWRKQKENIAKLTKIAEKLNEESAAGISLRANFSSMLRQMHTQQGMDQSLEMDDAFEYKNKEHDNIFNYVNSRMNQNLEETIFQELDALDNLSLEEFQETVGHPGVEYTEESKAAEIAKLKTKVQGIIDNRRTAEELLRTKVRDITTFGQRFTKEGRKKRKEYDEAFEEVQKANSIRAYDEMVELLTYTASSVDNLNKREEELEGYINKFSNGSISTAELNNLVLKLEDLQEGSVESFNKEFDKVLDEQLENWKKNDPASYAKNYDNVVRYFEDLKNIKAKRKFQGETYQKLLTPEGQTQFKQYHEALRKRFLESVAKKVKEEVEKKYEESGNAERDEKIRADEESITGNDDMYQEKVQNQKEDIVNAKNSDLLVDEDTLLDPSDVNDAKLKSLVKNRTVLKEVLNRIGVTDIRYSVDNTYNDSDIIQQIVEKSLTDPDFADKLIEEYETIAKEVNKVRTESKTTTAPDNSEDLSDEIPDVQYTNQEDVDKANDELNDKLDDVEVEDKQQILEDAIVTIETKIKNLREEDGSITDENLEEFKRLKEELQKAKDAATRGDNTGNIPTRKKTEEGSEVLTGKDAELEERVIEALIEKVANGTMTVDDAIARIANRGGYPMNDLSNIKRYIEDRTNPDAPEVGNNKQSFASWRRGKMDPGHKKPEKITNKETDENQTIGILHDKVRKGGEIAYDPETGMPLDNRNKKANEESIKETGLEIDLDTLNSPDFLSQEEIDNNEIEVEIYPPNTLHNRRKKTTGKYNAEYYIVYTNKKTGKKTYLGKLPGGIIGEVDTTKDEDPNDATPEGSKQLIALKDALYEANKEHMDSVYEKGKPTPIKVKLKGKTNGKINLQKKPKDGEHVKNNPKEVVGESNNRLVIVANTGGKVVYSNNDSKYKLHEMENNLETGIIYMVVPTANGTMVPIRLFTNKLKDTNEAFKEKQRKLVEGLFKSDPKKAPIKTQSKLDALNKLFNNKKIEWDGTTITITEYNRQREVTKTQSFQSVDGAMAAMGNFIVRVDPRAYASSTNGQREVNALANNGIITTNVFAKDGNLFNSTSFILDKFVSEATQNSMNQPVDNTDANKNQKQADNNRAKDPEYSEEVVEEELDLEGKEDTSTDPFGNIEDSDSSFTPGGNTSDDVKLRESKEDGTQWNKEEELNWLKSRLGQSVIDNTVLFDSIEQFKDELSEEAYNMLLEVAKKGGTLQGLYTDAAVYLYQNAMTGTAFHEAFHVVFTLALNDEQRLKILDEARSKYNLGKTMSNREVEEVLADKFMEYVQSEGNLKVPSTKIGKFFNDLFRKIRLLFNRSSTLTIQNLFADIELGRYKNVPKFKNTNLSKITDFKTRVEARHYEDEMFRNPIVKKDALDFMRETYFNIVDDIRNKNKKYKGLSDIEVISKVGPKKMNDILLNEIIKTSHQKVLKGGKDAERFKALINTLTNGVYENNWTNIARKRNEKTGYDEFSFTNYTPLITDFNSYLAKDGIIIDLGKGRKSNPVQDSTEEFDHDQVKVSEEDNTLEEAWYRGVAKINPRDTLTQRLKRFFDTIPQFSSNRSDAKPLTNYFGAELTYDGDQIFTFLVEKISGARNVEEMMEKLKKLEKSKPYVRSVLNKLRNNPEVKSDLFIHVGSKSFMTYLAVSLNTYGTNNQYRIFNSNRKTASEIIRNDLTVNFNTQNNLLLKKINGKRHFNKSKEIKEIFDYGRVAEFKSKLVNISRIARNTVLDENDLKSLSKTLRDHGFLFSEQDLMSLQSDATSTGGSENMKTFLNETIKLVSTQFEKGNNVFAPGNTLNQVKTFVSSVQPIYDNQIQAAFRNVEGESVYNLQLSNFLTKRINNFKNKKSLKEIKEALKNDPLLRNSPLIKDLLETDLSENIEVAILDGLKSGNRGTQYTDMNDIELEGLSMNLFRNNSNKIKEGSYGWYRFPIPSDSGTMPLIKMNKLSKVEIFNRLLDVAKGEFETIKKIKYLEKNNPDADILKVKDFKDKSKQFNVLRILNDAEIDFSTNFANNQEVIEDALESHLDNLVRSELQKFKEKGIVTKINNDGSIEFAESILPRENGKSLITQGEYAMTNRQFFDAYILNSYYANTQLTTLFSGSPSFYSNSVKYQKRNKQVISPRGSLDITKMDNSHYNVVYLKDVELKTEKDTFEAIEKLINDSYLSSARKKELIAIWQNKAHNITDGATLISPARYRDLLKGLNRHNEEIEAALQRVEKGIETIEDIAMLPPLKPFMFTQKNIDGFMVPTEHKNSEVLLTKSMAKMANPKTGELMSPELSRMYDMMVDELNPVDSFMFESAVKVGALKIIDFNELDASNVQEYRQSINNEDWGVQQETPPKYVDAEGNFGSQIRNFIIEDSTNEKRANEYQDLVSANLQASFNSVAELFLNEDGSINYKNLIKTLRQEIKERNLGESYQRAIEELENEAGDIMPTLPFIHPIHAFRIEAMLNSIFKNRIVKQKMPGGKVVNASSFGFAENLKWNVTEDGVLEMEVLLPWWSKTKFPTDKNGNPDLDALDQEGLLDIIGYRIPTEHKYSNFKMKPVGFTPYASGGTLIMPREVTTIAGLDFDIDAIYLMIPAFTRNAKGKLEKVKYSTDSDLLYEQYLKRVKKSKEARKILKEELDRDRIATRSELAGDTELVDKLLAALGIEISEEENENIDTIIQELEETGKILTEEEFKAQPIELQNTRTARNNRIIEIMNDILSDKESAIDILDYGSFDNLKAISAKMRLYAQGKSATEIDKMSTAELVAENERLDKEEDLDINLPSTQLEFFRRNMTGRDLTGSMANHKSHNAKAQFTDMKLRSIFKLGGKQYQDLNIVRKDKGTKISKMLASFVAAVVDNAAEPISSFINLNTYTANSVALLTRLGVEDEVTFHFINQPILKHISKEFFNKRGTESDYVLSEKNINQARKLIVEKLQKLGDSNLINPDTKQVNFGKILNEDISLKDLKDALSKHGKDRTAANNNKQYLETQLRVLVKFDSLKKSGDELGRGIRASKMDTQGTGPTQAANYTMLEAQNRIRKEEDGNTATILNMSDVFDKYNSDIDQTEKKRYNKMMYKFNEYGFLKPLDILNKIFPYNGHLNIENGKPSFLPNALFKIKELLSEEKGTVALNEKEANKLQRAYLSYKISGFDFFDYSQAKDIIESLPEELQNYKKNNPDSTFKLLLDKLEVIAADKKVPVNRIEYYTTGKDPVTEEIIRLSWEAMLNYGTQEEQELAKKLVKYAFFQSGFEYSAHSFMHLVPVEFWKSLKNEQGQSFNDFLRGVEQEIANTNEMSNSDAEFMHQFIKNNPTFSSVKVANLKNPNVTQNKEDGTVTIQAGRVSDFYSRKTTVSKERKFVDYIRIYDPMGNLSLYMRKGPAENIGVDSRKQTYVKVGVLGTNFFLQEYNTHGSISNSLMEGKKVVREVEYKAPTAETLALALERQKKQNKEEYPDPKSEDKSEDKTEDTEEFSEVNYYEGDITPSPDTIFVFGSNPEGRHGAGAAKVAKDKFGAKYGQGEGLQGNAYAIPTKDLRVKENKGLRSISRYEIQGSIQKMYDTARANPDKQFKVAYRNTTEVSLNGYTGLEMIDMFNVAAEYDVIFNKTPGIPSNVIFSKEWFDTGKLQTSTTTQPKPDNFEDYDNDDSSSKCKLN